ncbi:hypothetical protein AVEN_38865-1 [Araneus ventricosus]|uniref:Uncharacterized protein n=1 Tax=Araneus ventricosus TaxID=182803 RepID=A0A4Y2V3Q8_ARAVE|nr:hypothetical protein AVEN_38865-1 [Araneus ventricosus]
MGEHPNGMLLICQVSSRTEFPKSCPLLVNLKKLRVDEYIHMKDAITNDSDPGNHEKLVILPSKFTGYPRNMHEYAQDAFTYLPSSWRKAITIHHIQIAKRWHKM